MVLIVILTDMSPMSPPSGPTPALPDTGAHEQDPTMEAFYLEIEKLIAEPEGILHRLVGRRVRGVLTNEDRIMWEKAKSISLINKGEIDAHKEVLKAITAPEVKYVRQNFFAATLGKYQHFTGGQSSGTLRIEF